MGLVWISDSSTAQKRTWRNTLKARLTVASQTGFCRLRHKQLTRQRGPIANMGEFEVENVSRLPLEISYEMTVLQFLNLIVTDAQGKVVSSGHFGDRFAPTAEPMVLRLEPGDKFTANVHLLSTVRSESLPKGVYQVQAEYEYDWWQCVSEPLSLEVDS